MEDAMWNCISCEMWSAYKMKLKGMVSKVAPVLKTDDGFIRNPLVITDRYVDGGEVVYGEFKRGDEARAAKEILKSTPVDFELLDRAVDEIVWKFTNLFPGCLQKSIDGIRAKKKFFWDQTKLANRHWLAANMAGEALLGFNAFNTKKITGRDVIDFVRYRQLIAEGHPMDEDLFEQVLGTPLESSR
jgi:6-oxo-cyclohex-1-ene-carbonyl-CoA hydrolase